MKCLTTYFGVICFISAAVHPMSPNPLCRGLRGDIGGDEREFVWRDMGLRGDMGGLIVELLLPPSLKERSIVGSMLETGHNH